MQWFGAEYALSQTHFSIILLDLVGLNRFFLLSFLQESFKKKRYRSKSKKKKKRKKKHTQKKKKKLIKKLKKTTDNTWPL